MGGAELGLANEMAINQFSAHHSVIFQPEKKLMWVSTSQMCIRDRDGMADADSLIEAAETIKQDLQQQAEGTLIKELSLIHI